VKAAFGLFRCAARQANIRNGRKLTLAHVRFGSKDTAMGRAFRSTGGVAVPDHDGVTGFRWGASTPRQPDGA